jgi:hypothetical protein
VAWKREHDIEDVLPINRGTNLLALTELRVRRDLDDDEVDVI